jgi:hypothetical protein
MGNKTQEKSTVVELLERLDSQSRPIKLVAGLVCLAMQNRSSRADVIRHADDWIRDCGSAEGIQDISGIGLGEELSFLFDMLIMHKESGLRTDGAGKPVSILEFFRTLPDNEKLLLCAFDNYIAMIESLSGQDVIRDAIEDFDVDAISAEFRFLLGVVAASAEIAAQPNY